MSSPTVPVWPASIAWASVFGVNEIRSAASTTRRRVSGCTWSRPLSALEAVATETPASWATSRRVALRGRGGVPVPAMPAPWCPAPTRAMRRNAEHIVGPLTTRICWC